MCIHYAKVKFIPYLLKRIKSSRTKRRRYADGLTILLFYKVVFRSFQYNVF